jgi:peptidoglycan hydrolase CwlO-like protein
MFMRYNKSVMLKLLKPKVLGDVEPLDSSDGKWSVFGSPAARLNLSQRRVFRLALTKVAKALAVISAVAFLIFGSVNAPTIFTKASGDTASSNEQQQLQSQLQQLEGQIDQYENQIASYKKQGNTLSSQISTLNANIAKVNLQIQATTITLEELDKDIADTQSQIVVTQGDITDKKVALGNLLNSLYQTDHVSLMEMFLKNPQISDFWADTQNISLFQDNLRVAVQQVTDLATQLQGQEQQFADSRTDAASAQTYQAAQKDQIASTKAEKNTLLAETKGQESKYQTLLTQTQATAAQIRARIFELLGGGQLSFEDAYQFAKVASNATGIDPSLILAVLDRESALGQNVGKCSYQTAMSPSNQPIFLEIVAGLNLDPNTLTVSCANADGDYGGAMGPAQFEPSTWELYADGVANVTGHNPPSPWNDADAFVATGLYLQDGMTGCASLYTSSVSQERCVAAKYYAGSRWKNYLWTYGEAVVEQAQSFASDIATITKS